MLVRILVASSFLLAAENLSCHAFQLLPSIRPVKNGIATFLSSLPIETFTTEMVTDSSRILADWDRWFASIVVDSSESSTKFSNANITRSSLIDAVLALNRKAATEKLIDATCGRCMLGICASSAEEGIATLKSWVTKLEVPRGLLHGMDIDGVPIEFKGGVYIKYNSGGVYTFADIRKSQIGFNAIWKPGDAMLEEYDGAYRGVYFQVELADGEFRQYLLPLNLFDDVSDS